MKKYLTTLGRWFVHHWKTVLGVAFKLALIVIGCFAVFVLLVICREEWQDRFGVTGGRYIYQKNKVYVQYYANHTQRLKNLSTGKWISSREKWFGNEPASDSISVYCTKDGLRGFYNTHTGEITIKGKYLHAWYFSDSVAAVVAEDGRVRFINYDGTEAVPGSYHYSSGYDYVYHNGYCEIYNDSTGFVGLLRKDGTWALEQEYDEIIRYASAGVSITRQGKSWRLWKNDFTPAIDGDFDALRIANQYDAVYAVKNHRKQKLAFDGTVLEPFVIDSTYDIKYIVKYHEGEADEYEFIPEVNVYRVNGFEGLMDKRTGKPLTPAIYGNFEAISRSLLKAEYSSWEVEGVVMDLQGRIIADE